jgi:cellulose synthase/poly-beta-1,6-N-acetylglucosamine synthase-like glycosyltransferase
MLPVILGFFWLLVVFSMLYMLVIFLFTFGWFRTPFFYQRSAAPLPEVSIVVAVRNENHKIIRLLETLVAQDYPKDRFEIVIVNDHSDDDTAELLKSFQNKHQEMNICLLKTDGEGKKAALRTGINAARFVLIATTDGDCITGKHWLRRMVLFFELKKPKLISGPVIYRRKKGFWQHFFMLDFMGLVASGAGSLGMNLPLMANGANLMFSKDTYLNLLPEQKGQNRASGDDVFLLHAIVKKYGARSVMFIKDTQAIIETEPPENLREFFRQRIRWSSKATAYRSWWAVFVSLTVFLFNLLLMFSLLATVFKVWFAAIFLLFILLKMIVEFPLLSHFSGFAGRQHTLYYLFLFGWIYPFYITGAAITSFFFSFGWKGRKNLR